MAMVRVRYGTLLAGLGRLAQISAGALASIVLYFLLPDRTPIALAMLGIGAVATYLQLRSLPILARSPSAAAVAGLPAPAWDRENRRLAVACAALVIAGGVGSIVITAAWARYLAAIARLPAMPYAVVAAAGPGHLLQVYRTMLPAGAVLLLCLPGIFLADLAIGRHRKELLSALPLADRLLHTRFEQALLLTYTGLSVFVAAFQSLVVFFGALTLALWWGNRRLKPLSAEDVLLAGGLAGARSPEGGALLTIASIMILPPAVFALAPMQHTWGDRLFLAGALALPAFPLAGLLLARRPESAKSLLLPATAATGLLLLLGLGLAWSWPALNPSARCVVDSFLAAMPPTFALDRAADIPVVLRAFAVPAAFGSLVLFAVAVIYGLAQGHLRRADRARYLRALAWLRVIAALGTLALGQVTAVTTGQAGFADAANMAGFVEGIPLLVAWGWLGSALCMLIMWWIAGLFMGEKAQEVGEPGTPARPPSLSRRANRVIAALLLLDLLAGIPLVRATAGRVAAIDRGVKAGQAELRQMALHGDWEGVGRIALHSPYGQVRSDAVVTIGNTQRLGPSGWLRLRDVLIQSFNDQNLMVARSAAWAVACLGDPTALTALRRHRKRDDERHRRLADLAIARCEEMAELRRRLDQGSLPYDQFRYLSDQSYDRWRAADDAERQRMGIPH